MRSLDDRAFCAHEAEIRFEIQVLGYLRQEFPIVLHFGSLARPSHLELPGFPIDALRELEEAELAEAACDRRNLQGPACGPPPAAEEGRRQENPPFGPIASVAVLSVALVRLRRR